jgi:hypothetical protein
MKLPYQIGLCTPECENSEILYIVFITINLAIFTLYVVFCLIWLHLSFTVLNLRSRGILEA